MKTAFRRLTAVLLAAVLLCGCVCAAGAENTWKAETALSSGTTLCSETQTMVSGEKARYLQENYILYRQESSVLPVVAYGSTLYGKSDMSYVSNYLEKNGYTMVAGINGSFFDMSTGIPYGLVVTEGILRTSGDTYAVGFMENGGSVIGKTDLKVKLLTADGGETDVFYNKALTVSNGIGLYSGDYDTYTKNTISAYNVFLKPVSGSDRLTVSGSFEMEVTGMLEGRASCPIPDDAFVLAIAENSEYQTALNKMKQLSIGDRLTIRTEINDAWKNVKYACGGGDLLVEAGEAQTSFVLDSAAEERARTAVGVKRDGTLVLYTVDESESSAGLTLSVLAARMENLGCVRAINLDGGGSTAMGALYPGYNSGATVNTPTDGALRACANYIFLVRKTTVVEKPAKLFVYPYSAAVLPGARITLTAKATDANYVASELPGDVKFSATGGVFNDAGTFVVDSSYSDSVRTCEITANSGSLSAGASLTIVPQVSSIRVSKEGGAAVSGKLHVPAKSETALTARASYNGRSVVSADESFTWQVTGDIGTVDKHGTFTAANVSAPAEGILTVSYGKTKAEIAVTVSPENPFADVGGHWAEEYINSLYFDGILNGTEGKGGKVYYRPNDSMTRQEFVTALIRFLGVDTQKYAGTSLPFADTGNIGAWALPSMKAAYSLGYFSGAAAGGVLYAYPGSTITRQEAMVILARTISGAEADRSVLKQFADYTKIAEWAADSLAVMVSRGIISGSNGKLNPDGRVTRAEIAKMLFKMQ